jgi:SIT4-associating protein SAP185/190
MSILNRAPGTGPSYTSDGILDGGLTGLEALGEAIDGDRVGEGDDDGPIEGEVTQARELPVSSGSTDCSMTESDDVPSDDEGILEDIDDATPSNSPLATSVPPPSVEIPAPTPPPPSQADVARLRDVMGYEQTSSGQSDMASVSHAAVAASTVAPSVASEREAPPKPADVDLAPGDQLKQMYIQHRVLPTVVVSHRVDWLIKRICSSSIRTTTFCIMSSMIYFNRS